MSSLAVERGESAATASPARFTLVIRHPDALRSSLLPPSELALGEAFIRGDLDVEGDLEAAGDLGRSSIISAGSFFSGRASACSTSAAAGER